MHFTTIVGLEVHVQLLTRTKLFCGCPNRFEPDEPNVQTCPVCLGLPGALPVLNREAFRLAIETALALNCSIAPFTKWDRKQYYYPDLPKGYQISQYDLPFSSDGSLEIVIDPETGEKRKVGIIRAHLEEDAGKNVHDESGRGGDSKVDLNRAGTPLLEIVSEPDLRSAQEARTCLEELRLLLVYLGVSDCNMQEGSLRCDANVNLHVHTDDGHSIPTPIAEIKNLNSFRGVEAAIEYEARRQFEEWQQTREQLGDVPKRTVGWNADTGRTSLQREKEEEADYRYFPDPDLVPVTVTEGFVDDVRTSLPEFPARRRSRFQDAYQLSEYDATVIVDRGRPFADYFEQVADTCGDGKLAANWVTQDVLREMHERHQEIDAFPLDARTLGALLKKVQANEVTTKSAREVFAELLSEAQDGASTAPADVDRIVDEKGLALVTDTAELEAAVDAVLARNERIAEDVRGGKEQAVGPLIGQVMQEMKGADAKVVRQMLLDRIRSG